MHVRLYTYISPTITLASVHLYGTPVHLKKNKFNTTLR